jgi:Methyltransferase domain
VAGHENRYGVRRRIHHNFWTVTDKVENNQPWGCLVEACRACGGSTEVAFTTVLLGRHPVRFLKCQACASLQAERPYWIAEAYTAAIAATDTGAMVRNVQCQAAVYAVTVICGVRGKLLDSGGGAGVLCRLLRDHGLDAYVSDKYSDPVFARAYSVPFGECRPGDFGLISAVEVLEHYEQPAAELDQLFALAPQVLVATTQIYRGEGPQWWYLSVQSGQHIFFYSEKCLALLARRHGYHYLGTGWLHVFCAKPIGLLRRAALRFLLSNIGLAIVRLGLTVSLRGGYANRDHTKVCAQLAAQQTERLND